MKDIFKIILLLLAFNLVSGCSEDEEDYIPPFNDVVSFVFWSSPSSTSLETEKEVTIDTYIAFQDLSRGVITHEWRIPSGTSFLNSGFDETTTDYSSFVKSGSSTSADLAYVLFTELGEKEIQLINTFDIEVEGAVEENGVWTARQTFTITVTE